MFYTMSDLISFMDVIGVAQQHFELSMMIHVEEQQEQRSSTRNVHSRDSRHFHNDTRFSYRLRWLSFALIIFTRLSMALDTTLLIDNRTSQVRQLISLEENKTIGYPVFSTSSFIHDDRQRFNRDQTQSYFSFDNISLASRTNRTNIKLNSTK
jgi:hypothetical protein